MYCVTTVNQVPNHKSRPDRECGAEEGGMEQEARPAAAAIKVGGVAWWMGMGKKELGPTNVQI